MKINQFQSKYFSLHQIGDDVYTAISTGGAAGCNAGLINIGNCIIIFDTFQTPQAAEDLHQTANMLFGQTQQVVVNSHWHSDHIWGNQVFAKDSLIISSARTRQLISEKSQEDIDWEKANITEQQASFHAQLQNANERQRDELNLYIDINEALIQALPGLFVCLPNVTFEDRLLFHGSKRSIELICFKNGHTESDTVLFMPNDSVLFMGDLLFVNMHPYLANGDPQEQKDALNHLAKTGAEVLIPGHGPIGTQEDLKLMANYIEMCQEIAKRLIKDKDGYEQKIEGLEINETYRKWHIPSFFYSNIRFLCKKLD